MQTYNSFNELATSQSTAPAVSQMSVFNAMNYNYYSEELYRIWEDIVDLQQSINMDAIRDLPSDEPVPKGTQAEKMIRDLYLTKPII